MLKILIQAISGLLLLAPYASAQPAAPTKNAGTHASSASKQTPTSAAPNAVAPATNAATSAKLPPYNEAILVEAYKNPQRVQSDRAFAQAFAENFQIRLYDVYMSSYMSEHKLTEVPVPFSVVKPLIDNASKVPHPILVEMITSRFGSDVLISVLMTEIKKFEEKNGMALSISSDVVETRPAGVDEAIKALEVRINKLEARPVDAGTSTRDLVVMVLAVLSFIISLLALLKSRAN